MALMLGIDTGGTFTDAVLVDDGDPKHVVAKAKRPTTHHDLSIGLAAAVGAVLGEVGQKAAASVAIVSVSTTLATNALVEGHGDAAGLITFGFSERELTRSGIDAAVGDGLQCHLDGGHDAHGNERVPLDESTVEQVARELAPKVAAFAVAAQFSVRNPAHEDRAAEIIRAATGRPVTTSHLLSAKLDGPRRALTAALNARLLGTIDRLHRAVTDVLEVHSIDAPLMVVRGDGSLVSAAFAARRPIETVLSGPAASVVGAIHLADMSDGLVADIGGTTTDVAVISAGRPSITPRGAAVGGHHTMVEAVEISTTGLGGDSEVTIDTRSTDGPVLLGPERAIPICRLALEYPQIHDVLARQLGSPLASMNHGRFLVSTASSGAAVLDERERLVLARLDDGPIPVADGATSALELRAVSRLRKRGALRIATMTPTDAAAALGRLSGVDNEAAEKVAALLARQTNARGGELAQHGPALAQSVIGLLVGRSASFLLSTALNADGIDHRPDSELMIAAVEGHSGAAEVRVQLTNPLIAIGAPAAAYYPAVAERVGAAVVVPDHAGVANAIGAIVGRVIVRRSATVTQPSRGQFRVHLADQPTFGSVGNARAAATDMLRAKVIADADSAGAATPEVTESWVETTAVVNDREVFVEGQVTVEASGRPRF